MTTLGYILFFISTIIIFGSDRLLKKGKIDTIKQLVKIKSIGTGLLFLSVALMVIGNR